MRVAVVLASSGAGILVSAACLALLALAIAFAPQPIVVSRRRMWLAIGVAGLFASAGCVAHALFYYIPYCEGIWYYLNSACWAL